METNQINNFLTKYVKTIYDADVYIDDNNGWLYPKMVVYPYKFLKNSKEYDPEYEKLLYHDNFIKLLKDSLKYIGKSDMSYNRPEYTLSKDWGEYFNDYLKNLEYLIPMFFDTDYLPEDKQGIVEDTDAKVGHVWFTGGYLVNGMIAPIEPELSVKIVVSKKGKDMIHTYSASFDDYLSNNMNVDEQIELYFDIK
jgi:hypothetical protein